MSRRTRFVTGAVVAMLWVAIAAVGWWSLRTDGPEPVDLEAAVARLETAPGDDSGGLPASESDDRALGSTPATGSSEDSGVAPSAGPDASVSTSTAAAGDNTASTEAGSETTAVDTEAAGLAGVWTVVTSEGTDGTTGEAPVSLAGYRVVEVLAGGVDESTVVGRTADVAGAIELRGGTLVAATVQVEMATLRTDDSHRDSHARKALDTEGFPLATFKLAEPVELPAGVSEGERFSGSVLGDLTIKGVTNRVVFDLEAQLAGDGIVVVGSAPVTFSDYGVTAPTSIAVISVEDHGIMEFQLFFAR
ncbi:MAG: YceI family protein [bacterium]|nr:YceI family protein [bacterium]MDE0351902.1 YceI family protein [bacterium]